MGAIAFVWSKAGDRAPVPPRASRVTDNNPGTTRDDGAHGARLEKRLREAEANIERLDAEIENLRGAVRTSLTVVPAADGANGPEPYLDRFVRSFADGGTGSEYYRLAVDAHAPLLLDRMLALVGDTTMPDDLRIKLIRILGTERFRNDPRVSQALLSVLGEKTPLDLARPVMRALAVIGSASDIPALERYAELVPWSNLPFEFYGTIAKLAGSRRNAVLRRLLPRARDDISEVAS